MPRNALVFSITLIKCIVTWILRFHRWAIFLHNWILLDTIRNICVDLIGFCFSLFSSGQGHHHLWWKCNCRKYLEVSRSMTKNKKENLFNESPHMKVLVSIIAPHRILEFNWLLSIKPNSLTSQGSSSILDNRIYFNLDYNSFPFNCSLKLAHFLISQNKWFRKCL